MAFNKFFFSNTLLFKVSLGEFSENYYIRILHRDNTQKTRSNVFFLNILIYKLHTNV